MLFYLGYFYFQSNTFLLFLIMNKIEYLIRKASLYTVAFYYYLLRLYRVFYGKRFRARFLDYSNKEATKEIYIEFVTTKLSGSLKYYDIGIMNPEITPMVISGNIAGLPSIKFNYGLVIASNYIGAHTNNYYKIKMK